MFDYCIIRLLKLCNRYIFFTNKNNDDKQNIFQRPDKSDKIILNYSSIQNSCKTVR